MMGDIELQFDIISYTLIALLVGLLVLPVALGKDPDIHPFALLRQSSVAPSVYRFCIFISIVADSIFVFLASVIQKKVLCTDHSTLHLVTLLSRVWGYLQKRNIPVVAAILGIFGNSQLRKAMANF